MNSLRSAAALLLSLWSFTGTLTARAGVLPEWDWKTASPESQGLSVNRLESVWTNLQAHHTAVLLLIRDDRLVFERYAPGHNRTNKHYTASLAKALVGGMAVAVALNDGRLALDDRASKFVPQWSDDPLRSKIVIRQLGSHTSGLADAEEGGFPHDRLTGWKGDFWKRLPPPNDPFATSRDKTPVLFDPGANFQYSNPGMAMLGYAVTAALKGGPHKDLRSLLRERVLRPIGVTDDEWSVGYGQTYDVDGLPLVATWGGGNITARAAARVGRLMLRQGNWEGTQLLSAAAVQAVTTDAGTPGNCGMGWWSNNDGSVDKLPRDAFWGSGAGHQVLLVVPSLKLIAVRFGESLDPRQAYDQALRENFFEPLMESLLPLLGMRWDLEPGWTQWSGSADCQPAVSPTGSRRGAAKVQASEKVEASQAGSPAIRQVWQPALLRFIGSPIAHLAHGTAAGSRLSAAGTVPRENSSLKGPSYPPSPVIQGIVWAPKETIIRKAKGSDNWPLTWADDDNLYAAYGDGQGFEPLIAEKLSLGFAKIGGFPPEITGVNIRSASIEQKGEGKAGKKASGILMVEGVLYLLVRNANSSQLAWSADHGQTWSWSDWKFTESFGCPTFLNFGKNYIGARDGFVYVFSPDSPGAYQPSDRFVLARVRKDQITRRDAYEFFQRLDVDGAPVWTRDIGGRGGVFSSRGQCYRSSVSYNAALKRYLWCQTLPGGDARFAGGFCIYDAPEPWGPWTSVFYAETWDVGPGETGSFPTKWISADGEIVHLVFSGEDSFSVRKGDLLLRASSATDKAVRRPDDVDMETYFPRPESQGGWRKFENAEDIRRVAGMNPARLDALRHWLLQSDGRDFAADVIRRGHVVLEVERGNSARTDSRRVASVSKAICATVLAIASEQSQQGLAPRKMKFDDLAFDFIPWAKPLSDPRKERITVKQLLNHTSGLAPESSGARNSGPWEYVFGHTGDSKTSSLAFDPGTDLGYSTHGYYHAALVCEGVTGMPYDRFAIEALFKPIGVESWSFQSFDAGGQIGRHPNHETGLPARELARIAYCMLRGGRWENRQVIPKWFVDESGAPTHSITGIKSFGRDADSWSHGWELPARLTDGRGRGIPKDARFKPGSGGQLIAFVPSLDLVVTRQTGSSGDWQFEEYLRRACEAVEPP